MEYKISKDKITFLENVALNLRINSILATTASKSGHPTSCMSAADLISCIFFDFLKFDISNPKKINNDRFILSKGHAIPVVYAAWKEFGVIKEKQLLELRKFDSLLEGHPTPRFEYNEAATGSLGQGLAIGVGMAINAKYEKLDYTTYVMMGDGEISEGSVWEAAELASHYKLDNLIGIVDCNRLGQAGESLYGHKVEKFAKQFEAFGFKVFIIDGHNIKEIISSLHMAHEISNQPSVIIAKTLKGKGIEKIQNKIGYHGNPFSDQDALIAIDELKKKFNYNLEFKCNYNPQLPTSTNIKIDPEQIVLDLSKDSNSNLFDNDQIIATRKAFGYALKSLGDKSENIFAIDADVKNSTFTDIFEKDYPTRFVQSFIAEQSMIGISTGLEQRGKIPFASTFGAFFSRAHDQIRMAGIGRNALRLCGSHCGVSIGEDGPSQMALEDIAMMSSIPNSIVLYPSDGISAYKLTEIMANYHDGVSYLRTSRPSTAMLYDKNEKFEIGGCKVLKQSEQDQACIIAAGITLHEGLKAYEKLKKQNIFVSVIDLYSVKPLDKKTIIEVAKKSGNKIITVEDHYIWGGIGQSIASVVVNDSISVEILAVKNISRSGEKDELLRYAEIDSETIVKHLKATI